MGEILAVKYHFVSISKKNV